MHVAVASSLGEPSKLIGGQIRCRLINLRSSGTVDKPQNGRAYNLTQIEYKVSHIIQYAPKPSIFKIISDNQLLS